MNAKAGLLLVVAALLAGCTIGPSDRPAVAVRDAPLPPRPPTTVAPAPMQLPPLNQPGNDRIGFTDCTTQTQRRLGPAATRSELRYECGVITVELSPDEPRRRFGAIDLAVLRVGTGVPLMVVGDVAGEPGQLLAARLANQLPAELLNTFALIGFDRRGTGGSDPVRCIPDEIREQLVGLDPDADAAAQTALEAAREANQQCVQEEEERLTLIDSWHSATDLDQLRQALGADRLHAIGFGDGSRVLAGYLEQFTLNVGRIVLDGAPDPALDAIGISQDQALAAELAMDAFAADCTARPDCPLRPEPRPAVQQLIERLRSQPAIAQDGFTQISAGTLYTALLIGLADQQRWPELAAALNAVGRGDVEGIAGLVGPLVQGRVDDPARLDAALLTTCNDTGTRVPPGRAEQLAEDWRDRSPMFGALFALRLLICSPAPVPSRTIPAPRATNTPPVLLLGAQSDPLTPLTGTQRMADALAQGLLVTWQGHGHAAFPRTACVNSIVQHFLIDGQLPRNGTVCPP